MKKMEEKISRPFIIKNLVLLISTLVILFLAGEVIMRIYTIYFLKVNSKNINPIFEPLDESKRKYGLKPHAYALEYRINSLGFRNPEFSREKGHNIFRIINIGDSIAFGMGVKSQDKILSQVLERKLNKKTGSKRYEVINAGVPGYNTFQEYHFLKDELIHFSPDVVILNFCLNDADPIELEFETQTLLKKTSDFEGYELSLRTLVNQSYFFKVVKSRLLNLHPKIRNWGVNKRIEEREWIKLKGYILKMKDMLKDRGVPFLVVIFPWEVQLAIDYEDAAPQNDLASFFDEQGINYLDLFLRFQSVKESPLFVKDGVHPNELGHEIATEEILRTLEDKEMLKGVESNTKAGQ